MSCCVSSDPFLLWPPVHIGVHSHGLCKVGGRLHIDLTFRGMGGGLWGALLQLGGLGDAGEDVL
jgi:hypothetical protein